MAKTRIRWKDKPEAADYRAARRFIELLYPPDAAGKLVDALRRAKPIEREAKDLLRAAGLPLLPEDDPQVEADLKRIRRRKPLAPVLLVRGDLAEGVLLCVADGYHRICAVVHVDENTMIECRMAGGTRNGERHLE
jgi:hypothetical protein